MSDFNHPDKVNSQDFKNNGNNLNKPLANESRKALAPPLPKIVNFEKQMAGFAQKGGKRKKNFFVFKIFLSLFFFLIMIIVGFYYFTDVSKQITEDDLTKIDRSNIALDPDISILSEWGKCNSATDCVVVQKDCCTCEQGGIQQALNLNFEIKWQDIIKNKCSDVVCQGDNNCQSGEVICDNNICKFKQIEKKEGEIEDEDKKIWTEYEDASGLFKFFFPPGFKNFFIKESGIILFNSVALNGQIKIEVAANDKKLGAQELLAEFKRNDTSGMVFQEILAEVNGYQYYRLGQYERGLLERYFFSNRR
ncbi:hypothetical protein K8R32_01865 [bacterium]|nr:hypothetical protein [bacterium]